MPRCSRILLSPSSYLPGLRQLHQYSAKDISRYLSNLRSLYCPNSAIIDNHVVLAAAVQTKTRNPGSIQVPDSGYASAEEEEDDDGIESPTVYESDTLRNDTFEREFTVHWLTGFIAHSDSWIDLQGDDPQSLRRATLLEEATSLLSTFTAYNVIDDPLEEAAEIRSFSFPTREGNLITVELNDAQLFNGDHTSVGLQSWGSSIVFAEMIWADPARFFLQHLLPTRVLELGAGTGLLSIATAKLLDPVKSTIVATDYHPNVLRNLTDNIRSNVGTSSIQVVPLDWEKPQYDSPLLDYSFDVILAADVIYAANHAAWLKRCVEILLKPGGNFWLMIPLRTTGRHEGLDATVDAAFPTLPSTVANKRCSKPFDAPRLVILERNDLERRSGVGRADETGYRLYRIGWAS